MTPSIGKIAADKILISNNLKKKLNVRIDKKTGCLKIGKPKNNTK